MLERALLRALIALAIVAALSSVSGGIEVTADRIQCGFERANVCVLDDAEELD